MRPLMRRLPWRTIARLTVSVGLVAILVWRVNIGKAFQTFGEVEWLWVAPALPIYTLSKLVDAWRWQIMLQHVGHAKVRTLFGVLLIANMMNNLMPVRLGDVLRVQVPARRHLLPRAGLTATVFVTETLLDGAAFVVLSIAVLSFLNERELPTNLVWVLTGLVAAGVLAAALLGSLRLTEGWENKGWFRVVAPPVRRLAGRLVPQFIAGLRSLRDPRLAFKVFGLTLVAWLLEALMFGLFGHAFGLDLRWSAYIVIMVSANMIVSMPVVPSNIGPYEIVVSEVVAAFGVNRALAGGYAIGTHLLNIVWVGATGLAAMWFLRLHFEDVFSLTGRAEPKANPAEGEG